MKILFVMDSPEYLRFYDSVIEEFAARGHDVAIGVTTRGVKKPVGIEGLQQYADRVRGAGSRAAAQGPVGPTRVPAAGHHGFRPVSASQLCSRPHAPCPNQAQGAPRPRTTGLTSFRA